MTPRVLVAGLAGGIAEILWVLVYGAFAPVSAAEVAREVTASVLPGAAAWPVAPALGVGIHLALSIALAGAFVAGLMPYAATLFSKALFGMTMGAVLARAGVPRRAV